MIFAVYGIWEDLGAWKILLRDVPMICLHFFYFFGKLPKIEKCQHFFQRLNFAKKKYKKMICQAKLRSVVHGCVGRPQITPWSKDKWLLCIP